jgi:CHAP domain
MEENCLLKSLRIVIAFTITIAITIPIPVIFILVLVPSTVEAASVNFSVECNKSRIYCDNYKNKDKLRDKDNRKTIGNNKYEVGIVDNNVSGEDENKITQDKNDEDDKKSEVGNDQNTAVPSKDETSDQNTAVPSKDETSDQNTAVPSKDEENDQNTAVPSKDETSDQNTAVKSKDNKDETSDQNTAVESKDETSDQNTAVKSKDETSDQNTAVNSKDETSDQNTAVNSKDNKDKKSDQNTPVENKDNKDKKGGQNTSTKSNDKKNDQKEEKKRQEKGKEKKKPCKETCNVNKNQVSSGKSTKIGALIAKAGVLLQDHVYGDYANTYNMNDPVIQQVLPYWIRTCDGYWCPVIQSGNLQCVYFVAGVFYLAFPDDPLPMLYDAEKFWPNYAHMPGYKEIKSTAYPASERGLPAVGDIVVWSGGGYVDSTGKYVEYGHVAVVLKVDPPKNGKDGSMVVGEANSPGNRWSGSKSANAGNWVTLKIHPDLSVETWPGYTDSNDVYHDALVVQGFIRKD